MHDEKCDVIVEYWLLLKDYISAKDRSSAAEHIINKAVDDGFSQRDLIALADADGDLSDAYELIAGEEEKYDDEDQDEERDYGYEFDDD